MLSSLRLRVRAFCSGVWTQKCRVRHNLQLSMHYVLVGIVMRKDSVSFAMVSL